jgi:hypothetical protein
MNNKGTLATNTLFDTGTTFITNMTAQVQYAFFTILLYSHTHLIACQNFNMNASEAVQATKTFKYQT